MGGGDDTSSSPPAAPPQPPIDQPSLTRYGYRTAQRFGDIHAVNDSSGSGTTERIENDCKDDYYNFQHLGPKS